MACLAMGGALVLALGLTPRTARAVEPSDAANWLEHPVVDLAPLSEGGPDGAPRLLVVDAFQAEPGLVQLRVLQRDSSWGVADELTVDVRAAQLEDPETPWLVGLGPNSFVLVVASHTSDRTSLTMLQTDAGPGRRDLAIVRQPTIDVAVDDAAAADVDGNGETELVTAIAHTDRRGGTCQGSLVLVFTDSLVPLSSFVVEGRRLAGGVVGHFDDVPGDDLAAYAYPNCPAGPDTPGEVELLGLRLGDGSIITKRAAAGPDSPSWIGSPLRVDVDGDGRDEVLARADGQLAVLDPTRAWGSLVIGRPGALPLLATDADVGSDAARVAWLDAERTGSVGTISTAVIERLPDSGLVAEAIHGLGAAGIDPDAWSLMMAAARQGAQRQEPAAGWSGALAEAGCPDVMVPLAMLPCGDNAPRVGAAWFATRPVLTIGEGTGRRLMVASGLGWDPAEGLPPTPTPWAIAPPGWWRHGPSTPFALSELRAADAVYFRDFPQPSSTIERVASAERTTDLPGFTGTRLFVRIHAIGKPDPEPIGGGTVAARLLAVPANEEALTVARIPVMPGLEAERDGGYATVKLGEAGPGADDSIDRWVVTVVPINDWGEPGRPVTSAVTRDVIGPTLTLEVPGTTPVWPFAAQLGGISDPGTIVTVEGSGDVTLDRRGRFTYAATLAPWPQTIRIRAVDPSGNVTIREVSLIGGIDYRRLPWDAIVAAALLAIVAISGVIGTRRGQRRSALLGQAATAFAGNGAGAWRASRLPLDEGPVAEIEDLPPGGGLP
jgi:hypothetical protein